MRTVFANNLIGILPSEVLINCVFLWTAFDESLEPVHEHVEELISIHLLQHINRLSFPILESMAESLRIEVHFLAHTKRTKEQLDLKKHIVFVWDFLLDSLGIRTC